MNLKERINHIFQAYSVNLAVEEETVVKDVVKEEAEEEVKEETALAEKTLANGTVIYTDAEDFAVGAAVFIVNEEGERMPLPDGDYEYEGGGKTSVVEGAIVEIVEAEEEKVEEKVMEDTEVKEDKTKEEMSDETFTRSEVDTMIAKAVESLKDEFSKLESRNDLQINALKQKLSLEAANKGLRRTASATPKKTFKDLQKLSRTDRVAAIHEIYS